MYDGFSLDSDEDVGTVKSDEETVTRKPTKLIKTEKKPKKKFISLSSSESSSSPKKKQRKSQKKEKSNSSSSSSETPVKKKRTTTARKPRKPKLKQSFSLSEENSTSDPYASLKFSSNEPSIYNCDDFLAYWNNSKDNAPDVIGVDIGWTHLAIVGVRREKEFGVLKYRKIISHVAYIHPFITKKKNRNGKKIKVPLHIYWDKIFEIISSDMLSWIFNAQIYRIELQRETNPGARCVALALRGLFQSSCKHRKIPWEVSYVHGDKKYGIAPKECSHCEKNPIRGEPLSGSNGKPLRKKLAIADFSCFLQRNKLYDAQLMFEKVKEIEDKPDDIADAFYIADSYFHE